jgi:hypothetical protein
MRRRLIAYIILLGIIPVLSCDHPGGTKKNLHAAENRILQQQDGTVSLILDKATRYCDAGNPSNNTADWNIVISKPGRFKVWLSSATRDTSDLNYANSVRISLLDDRLEANPVCDKIVRNSQDVPLSYFRAESYIGSVYVSEPGEYNIQIISEKVIAKDGESQRTPLSDDTKLLSVILTPSTQ